MVYWCFRAQVLLTHVPYDLSQMYRLRLEGIEADLDVLITITGFKSNTAESITTNVRTVRILSQENKEGLCSESLSIPASPLIPNDLLSVSELYRMVKERYATSRTFHCIGDVGWLEVRVLGATDLDKPDSYFCTVQLPNRYVRTQTIKNTTVPIWNRTFIFPVADVHDVLQIIVYNTSSDRFVGQIQVPLLNIRNGKRRCYQLKNEKFELSTKSQASITIELVMFYNMLRSVWKTFESLPATDYLVPKPKFRWKHLDDEHIEDIKFSVRRLKAVTHKMQSVVHLIKLLRSWNIFWLSFIGILCMNLGIWLVQSYHVPVGIVFYMVYNRLFGEVTKMTPKYAPAKLVDGSNKQNDHDEELDIVCVFKMVGNNEFEIEDEGEEHSGIIKISKILMKLQISLQAAADMVEKMESPLNWSVPLFSILAILVLLIVAMILIFVPLRIVVMAIATKLMIPGRNPQNELLNCILRLPSNIEMQERKNYATAIPKKWLAQMSNLIHSRYK
ncbi:Multiple C2 and transmembrane domain-containing protein 2 [Cichlidogyrus casuarinus]|uniref:Multiple C2 and transmembrane domain-containing protein 2 n=1 Tax=Cichlidogyrus casuarinus TaxID=1844966 RepID=A0ABD2PRV9_9PLAT